MSSSEDTKSIINLYRNLFLILVAITALGIGLTYLHIPFIVTIIISLVIMGVKTGIVFNVFKKFLDGRNSLILLFVLSGIFFASLLLLPMFNSMNHITGTVDISKQYDLENKKEPAAGEPNGHK